MIYITTSDYQRLSGLIERSRDRNGDADREYLDQLEEELAQAEVVNPEDIPQDVITMRSKVRLKDLKRALFATQSGRVIAIEREHFADLFQSHAKLLEPIDLFQRGKLSAGVVAEPLALALVWPQQTEILVVADGPRGYSGLFGELADAHFIFHSACTTLTLTSK